MSEWNQEEPCKVCKESWFDQDNATRGPNTGICQRCRNDKEKEIPIFSLPLTSFPMIEPGYQSLLREPFPLQPRHFHCSPGAFPPQPRHFHCSPGAFPLQPRNQASKTKCQHSSLLISSIKKRSFVFLKEFHCQNQESNLQLSGD